MVDMTGIASITTHPETRRVFAESPTCASTSGSG
jgi:hypothetical protein